MVGVEPGETGADDDRVDVRGRFGHASDSPTLPRWSPNYRLHLRNLPVRVSGRQRRALPLLCGRNLAAAVHRGEHWLRGFAFA